MSAGERGPGQEASGGDRPPPSREDVVAAAPRGASGREIRVGIFVIAGFLSLLVLLFWLTDPGTFRGRYYVTTVVESAGGIRAGDPVRMRGVNVGRVIEFGMEDDSVAIRLEIEGEYDIPRGSTALLRSTGILQGMVVDIIPSGAEERVEEGGVLPGRTREGLLGGTGDLGGRAEEVLARVEGLLSERTVASVEESAAELSGLLAELSGTAEEQRSRLRELTESLAVTARQVEAATSRPELDRALARMDSVTGQLVPAAASLRRSSQSLDTVLSRMERGEGTLGRLSSDDELYRRMTGTLEALTNLADDIRENPKRYVNVSVF